MCILIAHDGKVDCEHGMGSVPGIFLPVHPPLDSPSHTVFIYSFRAVSNNCKSCFSKIPSVRYRVWHQCDCFGNGSSQEEWDVFPTPYESSCSLACGSLGVLEGAGEGDVWTQRRPVAAERTTAFFAGSGTKSLGTPRNAWGAFYWRLKSCMNNRETGASDIWATVKVTPCVAIG